MQVRVGKYVILSDSGNIWIEEDYVQNKGKSAGLVSSKRVTGYFRRFDQLLSSFASEKIKGSDANNLQSVLKEIADAEKSILGMADEIGKNLDKLKKEI